MPEPNPVFDVLTLTIENYRSVQEQTRLRIKPETTDEQLQAVIEAITGLSAMALRWWQRKGPGGRDAVVAVADSVAEQYPFASARHVLAFRFRTWSPSFSFRVKVPGPKFSIYVQFKRDKPRNALSSYRELFTPLVDAVIPIGVDEYGHPAEYCEQAIFSEDRRRKPGERISYPMPGTRQSVHAKHC